MGSFRPGAGNQHLHWYFNFTGCVVETVPKSLRLSFINIYRNDEGMSFMTFV